MEGNATAPHASAVSIIGAPAHLPPHVRVLVMSSAAVRVCAHPGAASVVVPIGLLAMGAARHRALLFKVLADELGMPCRILKGRRLPGAPALCGPHRRDMWRALASAVGGWDYIMVMPFGTLVLAQQPASLLRLLLCKLSGVHAAVTSPPLHCRGCRQ